MRRAAYGLAVLALVSGCASGVGEIVPEPAPSPSPAPAVMDLPEETHTGTGEGGFAVSWPADQLGFFTFDCPKCTSNVIVGTDGGEFGLVNAIGAYHGTTWLNTDPHQPTTKITVRADAAWTAKIQDHRSVPVAATGTSGKGDAVLKLPPSVTRVRFTARTRGHVALWARSGPFQELLLNDVGTQDADREVRRGSYVKIDSWDGTWTLTPS